jgi:hypothetical protein
MTDKKKMNKEKKTVSIPSALCKEQPWWSETRTGWALTSPPNGTSSLDNTHTSDLFKWQTSDRSSWRTWMLK